MFQTMLSSANFHVKCLAHRSLHNVLAIWANVVRVKIKYGVGNIFDDYINTWWQTASWQNNWVDHHELNILGNSEIKQFIDYLCNFLIWAVYNLEYGLRAWCVYCMSKLIFVYVYIITIAYFYTNKCYICIYFMHSSIHPTVHELGFWYCRQIAWRKKFTIWHADVTRWLTLSSSTLLGSIVHPSIRMSLCSPHFRVSFYLLTNLLGTNGIIFNNKLVIPCLIDGFDTTANHNF